MTNKKTTGKTGRPRKEEPLKAVYRNVRFTPDEDAALTEKVKQYGGSRSDLIRKAITGAEIIAYPSPETIQLLQSHMTNLRNIGTNLNAIAHRANTEEIQFEIDDLLEAQEKSLKLLKILQEIEGAIM